MLPDLRAYDPELCSKVANCCTWLAFRHFLEMDESKLLRAYMCRKFWWCEPCAGNAAVKAIEAYTPKVERILSENPTLKPVLLTYTVRNTERLSDGLDALVGARKAISDKVRKGRSDKSRNSEIEHSKILGGIRAFEVTHNGKTFHPHIHEYALLSSWMDKDKLTEEWAEAVGEKSFVNIRALKNGAIDGLKEVLKYPTKFRNRDGSPALTHDQRVEVYEEFRVRRQRQRMQAYGILRGVKVPAIDRDDLSGMTGPTVDYVARWMWGEARFSLEFQEDIPKLKMVRRVA